MYHNASSFGWYLGRAVYTVNKYGYQIYCKPYSYEDSTE